MNPEKTAPQPSPNHSTDLESRMARLVGLEEEPQSYDEDSGTLRQPQNSEPAEVQTEQPLSSNPFAKAGLVGAGTLAVVVFAGAFLTQMMNGGHDKPKAVTPTVRAQPTREPRLQQQKEEIEALKTKLALAQQANDVKAAQQQLRSERPTIRSTPRVERPVSRPTVVVQRVPVPAPTRPAYVQPRVVTVVRERVVKVPQPAATKAPTLPQQLPVVPPSIEPSVQATPTPQPTPDPLQEWARLSKLGSYGQASPSDKQSPSNITVAQRPISAPQPAPYQNPNPAPVASQVTQQRNPKSTVVGSSAKAKLVTAVYGETTRENTYNNRNSSNNKNNSGNNNNDNSSSSSQVFVAQLTEPLKAADNSIILPKDTQLLFNVASISEKGLMQLNVFKVSRRENGKLIESSVPQGALVMRGSRGGAVLGEQRQTKEGSQFASNVEQLVVGSVGQIGEELNRPTTKSNCPNQPSNTTNFPFCTQDTRYPRNILASIAQGGSKAILPGLTRRSQQAIPPRSDRNNIFVIAAGKDVELFVNQQMQF